MNFRINCMPTYKAQSKLAPELFNFYDFSFCFIPTNVV